MRKEPPTTIALRIAKATKHLLQGAEKDRRSYGEHGVGPHSQALRGQRDFHEP